jgi:hypothetical protein
MNFIARFTDDKGMSHRRHIEANHITHAWKKALGVAKSNNWKVKSVCQL